MSCVVGDKLITGGKTMISRPALYKIMTLPTHLSKQALKQKHVRAQISTNTRAFL